MQEIIFKPNQDIINKTENLKTELSDVGVRAFSINFENNTITIISPIDIEDKHISCAVKKAGYPCRCFKICNQIV